MDDIRTHFASNVGEGCVQEGSARGARELGVQPWLEHVELLAGVMPFTGEGSLSQAAEELAAALEGREEAVIGLPAGIEGVLSEKVGDVGCGGYWPCCIGPLLHT